MHFDLVDLRLLAAIADAGSLSKAAASFPIALSAASNRLRHFEQRCGLTVFQRHADGMDVTPAGRLVLDHARHVLRSVEDLKDTMRDLTGQRRISLRLAGTTVANSTFLPAALGPFLADYPEVDLQLTEQNSTDVLQTVLAGQADVGVLDGNLALAGVTSLPFRHDRLVLLAPSSHPLAQRRAVMLKEALDFPFVCLPAERAMQRFIADMAARYARPLKIRVRAPCFSAIVQLVAENAGVAMLPEATALRHAHDLPVAIVALDDTWATRELRICIRGWDSLSIHARQLVQCLSSGAPEA